jgi:glycosyltransferase involved in cell wall biosynthesis
MRVALITEGAYPYRTSGGSTWCHQLVRGLPDHRFQLLALTGGGQELVPVYSLPANVTALTQIPVWGAAAPVPGPLARRRARRAATSAAVLLCRSLSGDEPHHATMFRDALLRLAQVAAGGAHPLTGTPLPDVLADAWRAAGAAPRLSLRDAESAAVLLEHALRPLAVPAPPVDVCHPACGGLPLLVALAARWRAGIPFLLTEQGIYLRERYLDYDRQLPEAVKAVMLRFFRALSLLGYAEAATVAAGSRFNQRWQLQHGAHPARVVVVPGGVDPREFPAPPPSGVESTGHTVVTVGRIEPLKDLHTLIHAFWRVRRELPQARLRLVGPTTDQRYEVGCRALVRRLGLTDVITFAGPVPDPATAYTGAQVVVRASICEGLPYGIIEAMMCGRATVSTDVGGVSELLGDTGLVVPPKDPAALAEALVSLLTDPPRRWALGQAAASRARELFSLDRMLRAYRQLYTDAAGLPPPVPAGAATEPLAARYASVRYTLDRPGPPRSRQPEGLR